MATLEKQVKKLAEELEKAEAEQKEKSGASEGMEAESETIKAQIEDAKRESAVGLGAVMVVHGLLCMHPGLGT